VTDGQVAHRDRYIIFSLVIVIGLVMAGALIRSLFRPIGFFLISIIFNDSGNPSGPFLAFFAGLDQFFIVSLWAAVIVAAWCLKWRFSAVVLTIPLGVLDFSPPGTLAYWKGCLFTFLS
jgi:uncharacterized membrane protein